MAERRMFAKTVSDSDAFLEMPTSSQLLYFHLAMRADDDGFINNPKKIQRMVGCAEDDLKVLIGKKFVIHFESGVVVIKHWKIHNYIQADRYKPTVYSAERKLLSVKDNKSYTIYAPTSKPLEIEQCIHNVSSLDTQVRLGKDRLGKDSKEKEPYKTDQFISMIDESPLSEATKNVLKDWLAYKIERKEPYKPIGFQKLVSEVSNRTKKHGDVAVIEVMNRSMSNNWMGIAWDTIGKSQYKKEEGLSQW